MYNISKNESLEVHRNMKTIFEQIDRSLIDYWNGHNIAEKDLYCQKCNKLMINLDELKDVVVKTNIHNEFVFCHNNSSRQIYIESPINRWVIKGRILSGKVYFRHLCWDCLFKEIENAIIHNDKLKLISPSRFLKWKRWYKTGKLKDHLKIPTPWNSPVWWFRLIFDMTEEELNVERSKFDTASIQSFIRRYGENEGKKKFDEYCKIQAKAGCTLEYFVEKYGEEVGSLKYEEVCKNKGVTKKNCIKKYGEEFGKKFFDEYCKVQIDAGNTLKYFVGKYGEIEGKKKYDEVCHQKPMTLTNFIRKYGEDEGLKRYKQHIEKTSVGYSKVSQELFMKIDEKLGDFANDSFFFVKNYETEVEIEINGKKKFAKLDYELNNKVIEFNGDFWHANPKIYHKDDILTLHLVKRRVKDIWLNDFLRKQELERHGFKILIVWESDYAENPDRVVDECVKFLKGG